MLRIDMERLTTAIENGKTRGYSITKAENGVEFWYEYAIRKKGNVYVGYYFRVQEDKMSDFEDYSTEECSQFNTLFRSF